MDLGETFDDVGLSVDRGGGVDSSEGISVAREFIKSRVSTKVFIF